MQDINSIKILLCITNINVKTIWFIIIKNYDLLKTNLLVKFYKK